ncbi:hypothetical protein [Nocardia salmonicida]|uniref:hypothetical protein n=1 Tax=Nocardia salmonicida TaxID=53431 RepID=UPI002E2D0CCA|nr:hypothetical protein [Nocardia salmonicida]
MALFVVVLATESIDLLLAGATTAGGGHGASFAKGLGGKVHTSPSSGRRETASGYFIVAYVAISVPVAGLGLAARRWNLSGVGAVFALLVAGVATIALIATASSARALTARHVAPEVGVGS